MTGRPVRRAPAPADRPLDCSLDSSRARALLRTELRGVRTVFRVNRLAAETSPYLLQHADNPVDWYPWGPEAFARARSEDRPVLLSVGYSACHWCHVMAHESFESEPIAALMNERFVNVKVDREERPDVDALYMDATVSMTGQGGWPMTVFLTPEGEPFYAGTYYPPEPRHGMPSFPQLLLAVDEAWRTQRDDIVAQAARLVEAVGRSAQHGAVVGAADGGAARGGRARHRPHLRAAPTAASAGRRSSRRPRRSSFSCAATPTRRWRWCARRSTGWPRAACTTSSAAASTATPSTTAGSCRTSRRCSTTTPCWRRPTSTPGS